MTKLSVNINKIATIRNARGGNMPMCSKRPSIVKNLELKELQFIQDQMRDI